nr:cobaltochelatase subunit CobN [uncultured Desulfobulbus sp.]
MKIVAILFNHELAHMATAVRTLQNEYALFVEALSRTPESLHDAEQVQSFLEAAEGADICLMHLMGGRSCLPAFDQIVSWLGEHNIGLFAASVPADDDFIAASTLSPEQYEAIHQYLRCGEAENFSQLLLLLANQCTGSEYCVNPPERFPLEGIYHPQAGYLASLDAYRQQVYREHKPTVGVLCGFNPTKSGDSGYLDRLVNSIEEQGANALVVFLSATDPAAKNLRWVAEHYFMDQGEALVDVVISTQGHSLAAYMQGEGTADELFQVLGVPVLKAIITINTLEQWSGSLQGLGFSEISWNVAMPEFDGLIITVPIAAKCVTRTDPQTGAKMVAHQPIPERLDKLVRMSINWARLRHTPPAERKIAIIFHNYPPRNDNIGCAALLDSAPSAINLLHKMEERGYSLEGIPKDGKQLMEGILSGLTNDQRWLTDDQLAHRAVATTSRSRYRQWLDELPRDAREKMERHWGDPPGKHLSYKDELLVGGLVNGNVFIGLQPPRTLEEDAADIYHDPEVPIPYHYHGYYRWIRDEFKANAVIHFGTHGTLEWLPGKSVGLSGSCFPDIAISDLPNVYPYIIHNPGEGTGAKRRSYCCIVDYLTPAMQNADLYEEMAGLDVQLREYYSAKGSESGKVEALQKLIWEAVVQANLDRDLSLSSETVFADFDAFLEDLHAYLNELSDTHIQDGLHILGEPPSGAGLEAFLVALTRLSNGSVPSLRQALAEMQGYDYEELLANRGKLRAEGRTNGDVLNELHGLSLRLVERFHSLDFAEKFIGELQQEVVGGEYPDLRLCLEYIATFLVPALNATTDEISNTLAACAGRYVPAGPSGAPTRGTADILPTGRNFYSVDPRCLPSMAAWQVGVDLADSLLARHLQEERRYPESVGNVLWATDTMRTNGECVAECLYLMGITPIWEQSSGRVLGIKPIALEQLQRPRIDVTVRISGLFRDNFPNLAHLLDEAVDMVACLNEPFESNFIVKHVETEIRERVALGIDATTARREALYRVFGDKPGEYGAGVGEAIASQNWKSQTDLGNIYITWGGYIYGREHFGLSSPEIFKRRLAQVEATTKNMSTREYDALQIDDTYAYHAGMDLAIEAVSGKRPKSYYGDSNDPGRVKIRTTAEEIKYCFRARLVNPKWIKGMQRHGYHGAAEFSRQMDYVFGWEATADVIEDWMWDNLAEKFVLDPEMQQWLKEVNPYALQNMSERLLEAIERGLWDASESMQQQLKEIYLEIEGIIEEMNE